MSNQDSDFGAFLSGFILGGLVGGLFNDLLEEIVGSAGTSLARSGVQSHTEAGACFFNPLLQTFRVAHGQRVARPGLGKKRKTPEE